MRFFAFARRLRSAVVAVTRRTPSAFTRVERLFAFRARYRAAGGLAAGVPRARLELVPLEARLVPTGQPLPSPILFAAAQGVVAEYAADTGALNFSITPFAGYTGSLTVAAGALNGDGFPDAAVAEASGPPLVRVFDGHTGAPLAGPLGGFLAFEPAYTGGVRLAVADVDGDGVPDVIAAAQRSDGAEVRVFGGATGAVLADFGVTDAAFANGFTLAAGDFTGGGRADVVLGGADGWVRVYDPATGAAIAGPLGGFQAFGAGYAGGVVSVATDPLAGVANPGATSKLAVGTGAGPTAEVAVFDASGGAGRRPDAVRGGVCRRGAGGAGVRVRPERPDHTRHRGEHRAGRRRPGGRAERADGRAAGRGGF